MLSDVTTPAHAQPEISSDCTSALGLASHLYLTRDARTLSEELWACACMWVHVLENTWLNTDYFPLVLNETAVLSERDFAQGCSSCLHREERNMDVISRFVPCNPYCQWVDRQTLQLVLRWSLHLDFLKYFISFPRWMLHHYGNLTSDYKCCKWP